MLREASDSKSKTDRCRGQLLLFSTMWETCGLIAFWKLSVLACSSAQCQLHCSPLVSPCTWSLQRRYFARQIAATDWYYDSPLECFAHYSWRYLSCSKLIRANLRHGRSLLGQSWPEAATIVRWRHRWNWITRGSLTGTPVAGWSTTVGSRCLWGTRQGSRHLQLWATPSVAAAITTAIRLFQFHFKNHYH